MTTRTIHFLFSALVGTLSLSVDLRGDVAEVVAKARAYVGPDNSLNAVKSLHFTGRVVDAREGLKPVESSLDYIIMKPYRMRLTQISELQVGNSTEISTEIVILNNYDGSHHVKTGNFFWRATFLHENVIQRLRASIWQSLSFYRGIELVGGSVEYLGTANVDEVSYQKLAFRHEGGTIFYDYFDQDTGCCIFCETSDGEVLHFEGEIMTDGIRFPKKITMTIKEDGGKKHTITQDFERITVNETFSDDLFSVTPSSSSVAGHTSSEPAPVSK